MLNALVKVYQVRSHRKRVLLLKFMLLNEECVCLSSVIFRTKSFVKSFAICCAVLHLALPLISATLVFPGKRTGLHYLFYC